ncbi:MAG: hypothetical protein IPM98_13025 [Lewinellaceae bacterium]|nr:hypothetical protein [Lewinellaceae bacterium]
MKETKQQTPAGENTSTRRSFDQQQPAAAGRWEIPFVSQQRGGMMQSNVPETERVAKEAEKVEKGEEESWFDRIRKEAERRQMQEYLWQNMPQSIGLFSDANELARRFLTQENLDKSNVDILKERNNYFLAELKKIHLWLDHKENLSEEKRKKLESNRDRITEILNTPLSLNPKVDVTKFHVSDMKEEIPRIMNWLDHQPEGVDGRFLVENVQKMLLLLELYENPPGYWGIQKETNLRFFNIKQPGYSVRTIAFYFYGDFEKSHLITLADGTPAPGFVSGGQSVLFDSSSWSDMTKIVNLGVVPWLKIEGPIPDFTASTEQMVSVELAGKPTNCTILSILHWCPMYLKRKESTMDTR